MLERLVICAMIGMLLSVDPHPLYAESDELLGETIYRVDFPRESTRSAVRESGGRGTIEGVLPENWSLHNSANFHNRVTSHVMEDDGMTARDFLRIESVKTSPHNRALLMLNLGRVLPIPQGEQHMVRWTMRVRGTPSAVLRMEMRGIRAAQTLTGDWQSIDVTLPIWPDRNNPEATFGLGIEILGDGADAVTLDLIDLELHATARSALAAAMNARVPRDGYPPNLLRVSRFPDGLPFGWTPLTLGFPAVFADWRSDPKQVGPSGFASLRITATGDGLENIHNKQRGMTFTTSPFDILRTDEPHTFSLYAKGDGVLTVGVRHNWQVRAPDRRIELRSEDGWQRVQLTFDPVEFSDQPLIGWLTYEMDKGQSIWVDALQLEIGREARDYRAQREVEVQLQAGPDHRVQFTDEPPEVRWSVTGDADGAELRLRVANVYGEEVDLPARVLSQGLLQQGVVDYVQWPERPLGQYRVEAWVERAGERISAYDEVIVTRVERPRFWGEDAPQSYFGNHFDGHPMIAAAAKSIGFNWVRCWNSTWQVLEPQRGEWRDRKERIDAFRDQNLMVLAVMSAVPQWARVQYDGLKPADYPADPEDYANFIRRYLEYHAGKIAAVMIYNEPWVRRTFNRGHREQGGGFEDWENPHAKYDAITRVGFDAARSVDPNVLVVGINSNGGESGRQWSQAMVDVGGLEHVDVANFHLYAPGGRGIPGEQGLDWTIRQPIEPLRAVRPDLPVWMTEGSPTPHLMGTGLLRHTLTGDGTASDDAFTVRGDAHVRYGLAMLANDVNKVFYYILGGARFHQPTNWGWRIMMDGNGSLWPEAAAFANFARHVDAADFAGTMQLSESVHAYLFDRPDEGTAVAVVVTDLGHVDATFTARELDGVVWRDIWGNELTPSSAPQRHAVFATFSGTAEQLMNRLR